MSGQVRLGSLVIVLSDSVSLTPVLHGNEIKVIKQIKIGKIWPNLEDEK